MPAVFKSSELAWRKLIAKKLRRGKVDIMINLQKGESEKPVDFNKDLILSYVKDMQDILPLRGGMDNAKLLEIAMNLPEAMISKDDESSEEDLKRIEKGIITAVDQVVEFRTQEGDSLLAEFNKNIESITSSLNIIDDIDGDRIRKLKVRLQSAISDLQIEYDKNRFEQELVYYIEKYDISEEKSRLKSHINYFNETLKTEVSNGKKLNFISQEMGREINTIGSKANYAEMQNLVVDMKDQLEKIKEQLLNIL
jgi:uncharacterized protein (TIGR00255 family)